VSAFEDLNEEAVRAFARAKGCATFAAFEETGGGIDAHLAFLLGRAMATITMLGENRLHFAQIIDGATGDVCARKQGENNELYSERFQCNGSDIRMEQPRGRCKAFFGKDLLAVTEGITGTGEKN
jgi:hypothetical protein